MNAVGMFESTQDLQQLLNQLLGTIAQRHYLQYRYRDGQHDL
jgi:hypothetical protein